MRQYIAMVAALLLLSGCGTVKTPTTRPTSTQPMNNTSNSISVNNGAKQTVSISQAKPSVSNTTNDTTRNTSQTSTDTTSHTATDNSTSVTNTDTAKTGTNTGNSSNTSTNTTTNTTITGNQTSSSPLSTVESDLAHHDSIITLDVSSTTKPDTLFKTALNHEPYIQWILAKYKWTLQGSKLTYTVYYRESKAQTDYVDTHAQSIVNSITNSGMTSLYKEYVIHNWIVQHVQYDQSLKNYSAYDALANQSAVCQGYALLTYRMLTDAGIQTKFVSGKAGGQAHLWNEVYIDGKWYQLDATWDDPVGDSTSSIYYGYFNVTNSQLGYTHVWNTGSYPVADTSFSSELKVLIQRDPAHASQYKTILSAIRGDWPIADTTSELGTLLSNSVNQKATTLSVHVKTSMDNVKTVVADAMKQVHANVTVQYSYQPDERKQGYVDVVFSLKY